MLFFVVYVSLRFVCEVLRNFIVFTSIIVSYERDDNQRCAMFFFPLALSLFPLPRSIRAQFAGSQFALSSVTVCPASFAGIRFTFFRFTAQSVTFSLSLREKGVTDASIYAQRVGEGSLQLTPTTHITSSIISRAVSIRVSVMLIPPMMRATSLIRPSRSSGVTEVETLPPDSLLAMR